MVIIKRAKLKGGKILSEKTSKVLNKSYKNSKRKGRGEKKKRMKEKEGVIRIIGEWDDKTFQEFKARMREFMDWEAKIRRQVENLEKSAKKV
jgi:hypothetical protein